MDWFTFILTLLVGFFLGIVFLGSVFAILAMRYETNHPRKNRQTNVFDEHKYVPPTLD